MNGSSGDTCEMYGYLDRVGCRRSLNCGSCIKGFEFVVEEHCTVVQTSKSDMWERGGNDSLLPGISLGMQLFRQRSCRFLPTCCDSPSPVLPRVLEPHAREGSLASIPCLLQNYYVTGILEFTCSVSTSGVASVHWIQNHQHSHRAAKKLWPSLAEEWFFVALPTSAIRHSVALASVEPNAASIAHL